MDIQSLTILGGHGKDGQDEKVQRVDFKMGMVVAIVGPTGSGKTQLMNDIGLFANRNTPSGRQILLNGEVPSDEYAQDPANNPISIVTQHTTFLTDEKVGIFLAKHAKVRQGNGNNVELLVAETLDFANRLTGEPVVSDCIMTELSGGQTRALLIADSVIMGKPKILLIDEMENAGINRTLAIQMLRKTPKLSIFVTHDPRIALLCDIRIHLLRGAMQGMVVPDNDEAILAAELTKMDDFLARIREQMRAGQRCTPQAIGGML